MEWEINTRIMDGFSPKPSCTLCRAIPSPPALLLHHRLPGPARWAPPRMWAQDICQCLHLSHWKPQSLKHLLILPLVRGSGDGVQERERSSSWGHCRRFAPLDNTMEIIISISNSTKFSISRNCKTSAALPFLRGCTSGAGEIAPFVGPWWPAAHIATEPTCTKTEGFIYTRQTNLNTF